MVKYPLKMGLNVSLLFLKSRSNVPRDEELENLVTLNKNLALKPPLITTTMIAITDCPV